MSQPNTSKTDEVKGQVDEVVGIMHSNIEKVMQRGEHLDVLQDRTEDLQASSMQFRRGANRVRKQMWWKNMKMNLIIGGVLLLVILIVIVSVVAGNKGSGNATPSPVPTQ